MSIQKAFSIKQNFGKLEVGLLGFFWLCLTHHLLHIHRIFLRSPWQQKNFIKTFKIRSEIIRKLFAFMSTNWVIPCFSDLTLEVTCKFSGTGCIQIHHLGKESHSWATQRVHISSMKHGLLYRTTGASFWTQLLFSYNNMSFPLFSLLWSFMWIY